MKTGVVRSRLKTLVRLLSLSALFVGLSISLRTTLEESGKTERLSGLKAQKITMRVSTGAMVAGTVFTKLLKALNLNKTERLSVSFGAHKLQMNSGRYHRKIYALVRMEKKMNETRQQQLIRQMRTALNDLQSPSFFDREETLTFTVADMDFEFSEENLNEIQS